jgi:prepilin-type N-terminal cleavage/methylation domain-containing protein
LKTKPRNKTTNINKMPHNQNKEIKKEFKMKNTTKGFTLIELIMVTIILGILAAVAIPRYMTTVQKAEEAAEDAVISAIRAGLESYATQEMMSTGRRTWPPNPFSALATAPAGYTDPADSDGDPDADGEWTWHSTDGKIYHQRNDNSIWEWAYTNVDASDEVGDDTGTLASDGTEKSNAD